MTLVVTLYVVLFCIAAFAPLRWSIIAYLLLSTIDFPGVRTEIGMLNAAKGILLPLYLLWRLRGYSGHQSIGLAPIAWILLMVYAAVSGLWSYYPVEAFKLIGHLAGSLVICFVLIRATKGGYLTPKIVIPLTALSLGLAAVCSLFAPGWADEKSRFSAFTTAQGFAAFLAALYCIALCSRTLRLPVRLFLAGTLMTALLLDGSRIWFIGFLIATLMALLISGARAWIKICALGMLTILLALVIGASDTVISFLGQDAASNRIAAAITAFYRGDTTSYGLGTFRFRRELTGRVIQSIRESSTKDLVFGHGTCNGAAIYGSTPKRADPNRFFHNEWLRVMYEWGVIGLVLWFLFFGSIAVFAFTGERKDPRGYARPLMAYLPAFLLALAGENFLAAAGNAVNAGFLLLIALASVAHRASHDAAHRPDPAVSTDRAPMELAGSAVV